MNTSAANQQERPSVWAVVLGFNLAEDTVISFQSLLKSDYPNLRLVLVDNASKDDTVERVLKEVPEADIIQMDDNIGFARGNNVGIAHALRRGADYVLMINNDTEVDPGMVSRLVAAAEAEEKVGVAVPKIFYFDEPKSIWSAGCTYRAFPPRIDVNMTEGEDDGRFDGLTDIDFATTCTLLLKREMLLEIGLLDPECFLFWEDYEFSARVRERGYRMRFVPEAHMWHKVSKSTQEKKPNPFIWNVRGRSKAIFCRRHPRYRQVAWPGYPWVASLGFRLKGKGVIAGPFLKGFLDGRRKDLQPIPAWDSDAVERGTVVREV
jgi:hypothetical protein